MNKSRNAQEIYDCHAKPLKKFISRKVENNEDIEEILQETIIAASDSLPLFSGRSSFFTWLCGIANHEIADFFRKKKLKTILFSHFPFLETLASEALTPDEKLEKEELRKEVKKVLTALTEGYREILRLKYIDGLTVSQIARNMKTTFKSAESRLSRARESFKKIWLTKLKAQSAKLKTKTSS